MTIRQAELVVTLANGNGRERARTFSPGQVSGPLSVGLQGDWVVSAEGVASVHLWLRFDGERLYAASAGPGAMAYLQNVQIDEAWHEVGDRGELRFGQACLSVFSRPVDALTSVAPPPRAAPARAESRQLSPIERAAALPLPAFFGERLRSERGPSPVSPEPPRVHEPQPRRASARRARPAPPGPARARSGGWLWLLLIIPAAVLPFIFGLFWLSGGRRQVSAPAAFSASSAAALPPALASAQRAESATVLPVSELAEPSAVTGRTARTAPSLTATSSLLSPTPVGSNGEERKLQAYSQNLADKPVPRIGAEPWLISEEWRAHHERQLHAPNRAQAKVIFLGDSITEGWGVSSAYRESFGKYTPLNLGISGDFTQNVLWRIEHGTLAGTSPEVLVLMVGVNNLAGGFSPQETVAGIRAIVAAIQGQLPKVQLLLLGILPARQKLSDPLRPRISEANRLLANFQAPRVSFHDVGSVMLEPDGSLTAATMRDFIHPTPLGYERLSATVAPLIDALAAPAAQ